MSRVDGQKASVIGKSHIKVDAATALYELAIRGTGLTELPDHLALPGIGEGKLVHVLPDWSLPLFGIHAIWPDSSRRASLSLMFVRYLAEHGD